MNKSHKIARLYFNSCPIFKIFDFIEPQKSDLYVFHRTYFTLLSSSVCNLRNYLGDNFTNLAGRTFRVLGWCLLKITSTVELVK